MITLDQLILELHNSLDRLQKDIDNECGDIDMRNDSISQEIPEALADKIRRMKNLQISIDCLCTYLKAIDSGEAENQNRQNK